MNFCDSINHTFDFWIFRKTCKKPQIHYCNLYLYKLINEICVYKYDLERERFRTGFVFERDGSKITYHKTLPFAKVDGIVGDIIVRQTGRIYDDWNEYGQELNINDLVTLKYK